MNQIVTALLLAAEEGPRRDDNGQVVTHHWLWPETSELIWGSIASVIIFALLYKYAGPFIKKSFTGRTSRIQGELDDAREAMAQATAEAERIRQAKGDIEGERERLLSEADAQAEALLVDGRARLDQEIVDLEARAEADINAGSGRATDELRAEISRTATAATERVLAEGLDPATQQDLIEAFISKVGAS